jgi:hypothetical protein
MERRRKVLARHLSLLNPLADFRVTRGPDGAQLEFVNYGEDAGLGVVEAYEGQWFAFDNASGATVALGSPTRTRTRAVPVPAGQHPYLMARIRSSAPGVENWMRRVDVFVRTQGGPLVVGIDRETEEDLR